MLAKCFFSRISAFVLVYRTFARCIVAEKTHRNEEQRHNQMGDYFRWLKHWGKKEPHKILKLVFDLFQVASVKHIKEGPEVPIKEFAWKRTGLCLFLTNAFTA